MKAGKLPLGVLSSLLDKVEIGDDRVFLGPKVGEDAALIDFGDRFLVAKADPITFATDLIGWYLVQINANDIAVMGATPRWLMATLLLPEGTSARSTEAIFDQVLNACADIGVTLIGGHTEVTFGLPRPIAAGAMLGEVDKDKVVLSSGAMPGDSIVLTKGIAVEGAAVLAREVEDVLLSAGVGLDTIAAAKKMLFSPGISISREARVACESATIHAMHDPTEGGVATGLREMAAAADLGLVVDESRISVLPECEELCKALDLNPMGLIASGALLVAVSPDEAITLVEALDREGIHAREIGYFTPKGEGLKLQTAAGLRELPSFDRDELARFLGGLAG